jgi:holliday junction DNA helicase RuvA
MGVPAVDTDAVIEPTDAPAARPAAPSDAMLAARATADALSALANLGYAASEAAQAVAEAQAREPTAQTPALIRAALRLLAPKE